MKGFILLFVSVVSTTVNVDQFEIIGRLPYQFGPLDTSTGN